MNVDAITEMLRSTRGGVATLWAYSASLEELTLRVEFPGKRGNIHVVCNGTRLIHCPTGWRDTNLVVTQEADGQVLLLDQANHVRIVAGLIRVLHDVEPVFGA